MIQTFYYGYAALKDMAKNKGFLNPIIQIYDEFDWSLTSFTKTDKKDSQLKKLQQIMGK